MRIVSLLVAFCFSLNVMAATGTVQELEKHMDNYHYSLSVEWDQKDQAFYDAKTKEFFFELEKLIKKNGLSQKEIMALVEKKANNKALVEALKLKLTLLSNASSAEELAAIVKESTKDLYSQGASWNGTVVVPVVVGLLIAAAIGYSIWWSANHECVAWENQYVCQTYNDCYYGGGYYDNYGGYYHCYGPTYTTCGYQDVCVDYERK